MICGCSRNNEKPKENPIVTMNIKDFGDIKIELYPDVAENTVANFVNLVEDKFYDNNTIHRVQKGFVIQGGDPTGTGTGGPGYSIKGEFTQNGYRIIYHILRVLFQWQEVLTQIQREVNFS